MKTRRLSVIAVCAAAVLGIPAGAGATAVDQHQAKDDYTFAEIGDIPYGPAQIENFPKVIQQIDADPQVRMVTHLGDIKDGSSECTDEYFNQVRAQFDKFDDPLVYTVGDNEWTDCHRPNNGSYNPLERLAKIRSTFFTKPGYTMGEHPAKVDSQAAQGLQENVQYTRAGVSFAALHIVGSNNGMAPWTGNTKATPAQTAEVRHRTAGVLKSIHETFTKARKEKHRSVVLQTQADMFDPTVADPQQSDYSAFRPIVQAITQESNAFHGPVYLFNGDSHQYNDDQPLAKGSKWLEFYGIHSSADNLTRVTVDGSTKVDNYLRVTIDKHDPKVLSWTRVPFNK